MAIALSFLQSNSSIANANDYTFPTEALGAEDAGRYILVVTSARKTGAATSYGTVTVGGVNATSIVTQNSTTTNTNIAGIFLAAVPTGTTGDVFIPHAGAMVRCGIGLWRVTGLNPTAFDTATTATGAPVALTIDCEAGGIIIGAAGTAGATTDVWAEITEAFGITIETSGLRFTGAADAFAGAQTALAVTCTFGAETDPVGVAAAFSAAAAGGLAIPIAAYHLNHHLGSS